MSRLAAAAVVELPALADSAPVETAGGDRLDVAVTADGTVQR
jgi:hypothetical protein